MNLLPSNVVGSIYGNPANWDWGSWKTWTGVVVGGVVGAFATSEVIGGGMELFVSAGANVSGTTIPIFGATLNNGYLALSALGGLAVFGKQIWGNDKSDATNNNRISNNDDRFYVTNGKKNKDLQSGGKNMYFTNKRDAYNYAQQQSILLDMGDGYVLEREVSGFSLRNGDYIVLDPSNNTRTKSFNNQIPARTKSGVLQVQFGERWYNVKSHFHIHPSGMKYAPGRIGVSRADLMLMYNTLKGVPISILYRGNEWILSRGNQFNKYGFNYSLINKGAW